jgi:predicted nucleic-acid-binding protein
MLAVDTNIIVRYLVGDHPQQLAKATELITQNDIFVATTVLLETEWVLRSSYRYDPDSVADALAAVAGLPHVSLEEPAVIARALDWLRRGMDFADGLHLAKSAGCDAFVSFDQDFAKIAEKLGTPNVRAP